MMRQAVWAEVDLGAIKDNVRHIRSTLRTGVQFCAVVKADAYGHGAVPVAKAVLEAGADRLAVAMLQEAVEFHQLGMVVVDEQHRFGVEQRDQLRAKARGGSTPHLLVMTATPIPRTVALTVYGDLEVSTLRELPRGRQPIATSVIFSRQKPLWLQRAWHRRHRQDARHRRRFHAKGHGGGRPVQQPELE